MLLHKGSCTVHCCSAGLYSSGQACFRDGEILHPSLQMVAGSTKRYWFRKHFWFVKFKKSHNFAKCSECQNYKLEILVGQSEQRESIRKKQLLHRTYISHLRSILDFKFKLADHFPETFLVLLQDGMDNAKTNVPRLGNYTKTKDNDHGDALKTQLVGERSVRALYVSYFFIYVLC